MEVRFRKAFLDRLEADPAYDGGLPVEVVTAFRKRLQAIRAAPNEHVLHALKSLRFQQLAEKRAHQYSMRFGDQITEGGFLDDAHDPDQRYAMRLTDQRWLVLEFEREAPDKVVALVDMEDCHEEFDHAATKDC